MNHVTYALLYRLGCSFKQRWILMLIFITIPIFTSALFLFIKYKFSDVPFNRNAQVVFYSPKSKSQILWSSHITILVVCPDDADIQVLMKAAKKMFPRVGSTDLVFKKTPAEVRDYLRNASGGNYLSTPGYGVNIVELSQTKLTYTLRSTHSKGWHTAERYPKEMIPGPLDSGEYYLVKCFLPLQIAINEAYSQTYLHIKPTNWTLQQFPYPAFEKADKFSIMYIILGFFYCLSMTFIFSRFLVSITQEKASGIKELLKINGVNSWKMYGSWFFMFGLITLLVAVMVAMIGKYPLSVGAVLPYTHPILLFIILLIYYWSALCSFGFIASFIVDPKYAALLSVVYWIGTYTLVSQILRTNRSTGLLVAFAFIPNGGMYGVFEAIAEFEAADTGATFHNLFSSAPVSKNILPIGVNLCIMVGSMFIYLGLMAYVDAIKPGPFGRGKPWHFIFPNVFGKQVHAENVSLLSDHTTPPPTPTLVEDVSDDTPIGIEAKNLLKVYGVLKAVNNLNIKIYKNQITALLGHNGAGKSTFFAMLSGMQPPTKGSVFADGYDVFDGSNIELFRRDLGFCPQHDLLIDELTVEQHLIFFGLLNGLTRTQAHDRSSYWATKFKIYESRHKLVRQLSGGMKRKLCLSLALVGDPKYLLLDEPTSGLDPESRRDIWDVLLTIRGNRTIIITTHFMEEADVLGDRIAIVAHGKLKCYGTAMYLKRHYGSGYQLNFTLKDPKLDAVGFVQQHIPSASLIHKTEKTVEIVLPATEIMKFPGLFRAIDANLSGKAESFLSCTTMDDVFLKVQQDEGVQMTIDELDMPTMIKKTNDDKDNLSKCSKLWYRVKGLFVKRYLMAFYNWKSFVVFIVLFPAFAICLTMSGINSGQDNDELVNLSLTLDVYENSHALISRKAGIDPIATFAESEITNSGGTFFEVEPDQYIIKALLDSATQDLVRYRSQMVFSLSSRNVTINALYSTLAFHAAPITYGILANALLQQVNSSARITTYNFPYDFNDGSCTGYTGNFVNTMIIWVVVFGSAILYTTSYFIIFPHIERVTSFKHLELMTGTQPIVYWLTNFLSDLSLFVISVVVFLLGIIIFDEHNLFQSSVILETLVLVLILFGISNILFAYFCSFFFQKFTTAMELFIFFTFVCTISSTVAALFESSEWLTYIFDVIPWVPYVECCIEIMKWCFRNSWCTTCTTGIHADICKEIFDNSGVHSFGINRQLYYFAGDSLLYLVLILLLEHGYYEMIATKIRTLFYGSIVVPSEPVYADVASEKAAVTADRQRQGESSFIFVCDNLGKKFSRTITAVCDVTFAIHKGDCFGLLGANGAGKSTTFGMLTGWLTPTSGDSRILNYSLTANKHQYLKRIGYCPQLDGLLPDMSARILLTLFGRLRGIPSSVLSNMTKKWINALDMSDICNRPCKQYSGGNKRKLSTALALIGDPPVVLLDEPSTGVDPVVRRKIWSILKHCREINGQTIILTTHSMDECEAVCGRLSIMVKGLMKCIGTVTNLKTVFGNGYILLIKLVFTCTEEDMKKIQNEVESKFAPHIRLQDKRQCLFNYHVDSATIKLHAMFETLLSLKSTHDVIEEFSISDISLEQVFLSLTRGTAK